MKKFLFLPFSLLLLLGCKTETSAPDPTAALISGKAGENYADREIYLKYIQGDSVFTKTFTVTEDGSFEFRVTAAEFPAKAFLTTDLSNHAPKISESAQLSTMIYFHYGSPSVPLQFGNKKDIRFFVLDQGTMQVTISDSIYNSTLEQSPANEDLQELAVKLHKVMAKQVAHSETDPTKITDPEELDRYMKRSTLISTEKNKVLDAYIQENPDTYASVVAFNVKPFIAPEDVALFSSIDAELRNSSLAAPGRNKVMQYVNTKNVDDSIASFTLENERGEKISLEDIEAEYILLDFWASWCGPCRKENRKISEFYTQYDPKDFQMVGISVDDDREKWLQALEEDKVTWTALHDTDKKINDEFGVGSYPTNFLIDRNHRIIAKNLGAEELKKKLEDLM